MARTLKPSGKIEKRKTNLIQQNKLVLIVCEDEKSGCDYLKLMAKHLRLHTTCIVESSETGSAPISVVEDAIKRIALNKKEKCEPFELVFCVWDIDEHTSLSDARQLALANNFNVIESDPCFEFWLLLHFAYHAAPIVRISNKSSADACVKLLKQYITDYDKSKIINYFHDLILKLETAKSNADKLHTELERNSGTNPKTNLNKLIEAMEKRFIEFN